MSNMKCPICGKDLVEIEFGKRWFLACDNSKCRCKGVASYVVWEFLTVAIKNRKALTQELIHTRKALEIAVKRLGYIKNNYKSWTPDRDEQMIAQAVNGLDEIKTALEQKD